MISTRTVDIDSTELMLPGRSGTDGGPVRFLLLHLGPAVAVLVALLLLETTPLDRLVSDLFVDAAGRTFPLRNNFFLEVVMHRWAKYTVIVIGLAVLVTCVLSCFVARLAAWRRLLLFLTLGLGLAPAVVSALKMASPRYCPYDLAAYGGYAPHLGLFDLTAAPFGPGHCFPGGHASAGFCLLAFYFAGYALKRPQFARAGLWTGIIAGLALGTGRVAQGAHFFSHNLWTGLICWTVTLLLYILILSPRRPVVPQVQAVAVAPASPSASEHAI